MNSDMRSGFLAGSGVDPANLKVVLLSIGFATILVIAAWIIGEVIKAVGEGEMSSQEAMRACITLGVVVCVVLSVLSWV